ncbi:MAG: hypothetical protein HOE90_07245 [Bacteriovoracaceae bacterium]|jgi:hypothetical protein|nr:hypothetical protein [Bacteriovoracaceae bacterium]
MKMLVLLLSLSAVSLAAASTDFSAFSVGDKLYVTVLGDSCNSIRPSLLVAENCKDDRVMKNLAYRCTVKFSYASTKMYCNDKEPVPRVMSLSLSQSNVAKEAKLLYLEFNAQHIKVQLDQ